MQILYNFGFQPILFFAQIVNFVIIYLLLKKFMYKPVLKLLKERREKIAVGLKQAEESTRLLEQALKKEEEILRDAQEKSQKLLDEAKKQRDAIIKQTEQDTKRQVAAMLGEARTQIAQEAKAAEKNLASKISKLAVDFLEKSLTEVFGEKEQELVLKKALIKLKQRAD